MDSDDGKGGIRSHRLPEETPKGDRGLLEVVLRTRLEADRTVCQHGLKHSEGAIMIAIIYAELEQRLVNTAGIEAMTGLPLAMVHRRLAKRGAPAPYLVS